MQKKSSSEPLELKTSFTVTSRLKLCTNSRGEAKRMFVWKKVNRWWHLQIQTQHQSLTGGLGVGIWLPPAPNSKMADSQSAPVHSFTRVKRCWSSAASTRLNAYFCICESECRTSSLPGENVRTVPKNLKGSLTSPAVSSATDAIMQKLFHESTSPLLQLLIQGGFKRMSHQLTWCKLRSSCRRSSWRRAGGCWAPGRGSGPRPGWPCRRGSGRCSWSCCLVDRRTETLCDHRPDKQPC